MRCPPRSVAGISERLRQAAWRSGCVDPPARKSALGERGNAQLKWFRVLATELRCRPGRCTRMIKAVLTVYYREHHAAAGGTIWYSGRQLAPRPVPAQAPASLVADDAVINYQVIEREWKSRFYNLCSRR